MFSRYLPAVCIATERVPFRKCLNNITFYGNYQFSNIAIQSIAVCCRVWVAVAINRLKAPVTTSVRDPSDQRNVDELSKL